MTADEVVGVNLRIGLNACDLTICLLVAGSTIVLFGHHHYFRGLDVHTMSAD